MNSALSGVRRRGQFDRVTNTGEINHDDDRFGRVVVVAAVVDETNVGSESLEF